MRKLFAIAIALSMMSGLYALKLGIGAAYEDVANDARYFAIKADARVPLIPIIDVRGELLNVALPENAKGIHFGTFTGSDLLIKLPMPMAVQPYIALGVWFNMSLEEGSAMDIGLKGGLGGEIGLGGLNVYLEGGLNKFTWVKDADPATANKVYVQGGVVVPVPL